MASIGGSNVVKSGLVLSLDAANARSYVSGSTTWRDLSGNNNSGSLTNGPTFSSINGGSIVFNGSNNFIGVVPPVSSLSNVSQFSYSAFVNFNTKTTGNAFFSYGSSNVFTTDIIFAWDTATSVLFFQVNNGTDGAASFSYNTFNTWINISVVYNGSLSGNSNRLKAYINGNEITLTYGSYTVPATTASPSSPLCRLGIYASDSSNAWGLNGRIATTQIYNRALSADEVLQNYNATQARFNL
jgi:hypothetical protein